MTTPGLQRKRVLISGGGIAGLTLSYWLHRFGMQPIVVERAQSNRSDGYLIDFLGSGWDVADWMGILPDLRRQDLVPERIVYKDRRDRTTASVLTRHLYEAIGVSRKHLLLNRADLEESIYESVRNDVEIRFGTTVARIDQEDDSVLARLSDGREERVDLLIGADGIHSKVRELVFGAENQFSDSLGYSVATFSVPPGVCRIDDMLQIYLDLNRQAILYQYPDGRLLAYLLVRSDEKGRIPQAGRHETVKQWFKEMGWKIPTILAALSDETPIFLDAVTQIQMPQWYDRRVALIGDAAHCLTLLSGQGASFAMAGAYVLATELFRHQDHGAAFAAYESRLRPSVENKQNEARSFASSFIPSSRWRLWLHQLFIKLARFHSVQKLTGRHFSIAQVLVPEDRPSD